ncbi:MAG: DUF2254 domain-containing protein [Phycisphaerae bacterium]
MKVRIIQFFIVIRESYWFLPLLMTSSAFVLSIATVMLDLWLDPKTVEPWVWPYANSPDAARALLGTIAGSMITVAGVAYAITISAVAYAASQHGPRLLSNFMRDRANQFSLGVFLATFMYCLMVMRTVQSAFAGDDHTFVPHISVLVAMLLTMGSIGALIFYIHHIPESIHVSRVAAGIGHDLLRKIDFLYPEAIGDAVLPHDRQVTEEKIDAMRATGTPIVAAGVGYLQALDGSGLLSFASRQEAVIFLPLRPGDFVYPGCTLAYIDTRSELPDWTEGHLRDMFVFGPTRTQSQDPDFLVDQLVDMSARALSPGQNDPFTAMTCIEWLGAALRKLADRAEPCRERADRAGQLRVVTMPSGFGFFANQIFQQLRPYVSTDTNAGVRTMEVLADVANHVQIDERRIVLERHGALLVEACTKNGWDAHDLNRLQSALAGIRPLAHLPADAFPKQESRDSAKRIQ